jgi:triacylglycerol lipase
MLRSALFVLCLALSVGACVRDEGLQETGGSGDNNGDGGDVYKPPANPPGSLDAGDPGTGSLDAGEPNPADGGEGALDGGNPISVPDAGAPSSGDAGTPVTNPNPHAPLATIVLVHGMGGFKTLLGVDYFYGVPESWRAQGANVYVASLTPVQTIADRAAQLKSELDEIPGPLIFVAHSQGGLDTRYLVSTLGYASRTEAVVTIASPHHGTSVADVALGIIPGPAVDVANLLLNTFGWSIDDAREMTTANMNNVFNPATPDAPGVLYWSFSGIANPFALGGQGYLEPSFILTWSLMEADGIHNDGVVPEASAHWGNYRGLLPADHLEEVGQPLGITPAFDHAAFYANLLQSLHDQGL